jgi:PAS domain S-box-containing protein
LPYRSAIRRCAPRRSRQCPRKSPPARHPGAATQQRDEIGAMARAVEVFKENDRQLRRTQQHLTKAQAIAFIGSFEHDFRTAKSHWSAALYTILGHSAETLPASTANISSWVDEADRTKLRQFVDELGQHREPAGIDIRIIRPDGGSRSGHIESQLVRDDRGAITGSIGTLQDITEQRRLEEIGRALEAQLHHLQRLEALGTLAGGIAHDLNNALVPTIMMTEIVMDAHAEDSAERTHLALALAGARRAKELVRRILTFSRKEMTEKHQIDLVSLTTEAMTMLRASLPATIELTTQVEAVPAVFGDSGQLYQVVVNLVTNAAQAIGDAPGRTTVTLRSVPSGSRIELTVADTGSGMDEATQQRIFDPFFTTKAVNEGTGLGLSIVHGIVVDHGGTIAATSQPGRGSTFCITLPAADDRREADAETVPEAA